MGQLWLLGGCFDFSVIANESGIVQAGIISLLSKNRGTGNILKDSLKISYIRLIHSLSRNTICLVTIFSTPFLLSDKFFRQKNMLGRFFKSYSSSQSEKRLTINFRFSSAVCRARLRFLKCFIFEDFIIKIRCEIVWQSYAVALQSKMTGKSWGRDQSSFLWCTTAMAHVPTQKKKPEVDPISFATSMIFVWFQQDAQRHLCVSCWARSHQVCSL